MSRQEKNKVYNTISLSPNLSMPAKGDANSTTSSAVARGTIDIRENPTQDISVLSRDTANSLNELGRIFDKQKIEEQQELAKAFGEEAFRLAHNLPDDGSGRKVAVHAIIGGIMSQIIGTGFASGAIGAGVNEAIIGEIKKIKDPGTAQIVSAIVGAAAAKATGGNTGAGAASAASGTKWNFFLMEYPSHYGIDALALQTLKKTDGNTLSSIEIAQYIQGMYKILSESEPALSDMQNMQAENIDNYPKAISYLVKSGITKESAIQFFKGYNELLRKQDWTVMALAPMPPINVIADKESGKLMDVQPPHMRPYKGVKEAHSPKVFTGENLKLPDSTNKDEFSWLSSIATNGTTEVSNRLPSAIQMSGYWVKPLSIYLKTGGVVGLGWTIRDMKQDWNTYSGGRLAIAWTADVIPIGASALGAYGLGPMGILGGPFGSVAGAAVGDWFKYEIKKNIPKNTETDTK